MFMQRGLLELGNEVTSHAFLLADAATLVKKSGWCLKTATKELIV